MATTYRTITTNYTQEINTADLEKAMQMYNLQQQGLVQKTWSTMRVNGTAFPVQITFGGVLHLAYGLYYTEAGHWLDAVGPGGLLRVTDFGSEYSLQYPDHMTIIVFEDMAAIRIDRWISGVDTNSASAV